MNEASLARLDAYLADSLSQLFTAYGLPPTSGLCRKSSYEGGFAATVGFTGQRLKGTLVLILERDILLATMAENIRRNDPPDELLADWGGELANQLLGRLKNGLWASGIEIVLGTPVAFAGGDLDHILPPSSICRCSACLLSAGLVVAKLLIDCAPDVELGEVAENSKIAPDGEFTMF